MWQDNIKINLETYVRYDYMDWILFSQDAIM
jgi:hypothetical protein